MAEKELFLDAWEKEFATTMKVLRAYPTHRKDFRPHEKSKTAKELAWTFVIEEKTVIEGAIAGNIDFREHIPPATMEEVISEYERAHKVVVGKVKSLSEQELNNTVKFPVAPKTMADLRKIDVFWGVIRDMIHHRGQFSVYLRFVDGKVPSIYGPSADEPWF